MLILGSLNFIFFYFLSIILLIAFYITHSCFLCLSVCKLLELYRYSPTERQTCIPTVNVHNTWCTLAHILKKRYTFSCKAISYWAKNLIQQSKCVKFIIKEAWFLWCNLKFGPLYFFYQFFLFWKVNLIFIANYAVLEMRGFNLAESEPPPPKKTNSRILLSENVWIFKMQSETISPWIRRNGEAIFDVVVNRRC